MPDELKQCTRCLQWLPATKEYFYLHKSKFRAQCKTCHCAVAKETRDPERQRQYLAEWQRNNPDKVKAKKERYKQNHPDAANQASREWYQRNAESQRERTQKYKEANQEKVLARAQQWARENRDKCNLKTQRYAARKEQLPDDLTMEQWQYAIDYFGNACAVCGRKAGDGYHLAADHWIPLFSDECPGTTRFNVIPLCHSITKGVYGACNNSKRSALPQKWLTRRFGEERAAEILAKIGSYFEHLRSLDQATNIA